jgi:hypothetical protein
MQHKVLLMLQEFETLTYHRIKSEGISYHTLKAMEERGLIIITPGGVKENK